MQPPYPNLKVKEDEKELDKKKRKSEKEKVKDKNEHAATSLPYSESIRALLPHPSASLHHLVKDLSVDVLDEFGYSPLLLCARHHRTEFIQQLFSIDAAPWDVDLWRAEKESRWNAAHFAAESGSLFLLSILLAEERRRLPPSRFSSFTVSRLLNAVDHDGCTPVALLLDFHATHWPGWSFSLTVQRELLQVDKRRAERVLLLEAAKTKTVGAGAAVHATSPAAASRAKTSKLTELDDEENGTNHVRRGGGGSTSSPELFSFCQSFGFSNHFQLGYHCQREFSTKPKTIQLSHSFTASSSSSASRHAQLPLGVSEVFAHRCYSLLIAADGVVYSFGNGQFGRLGHGNTESVVAPTAITTFQSMKRKIVHLALTDTFFAALSEDGRIFLTGTVEFFRASTAVCAVSQSAVAGPKEADMKNGDDSAFLSTATCTSAPEVVQFYFPTPTLLESAAALAVRQVSACAERLWLLTRGGELFLVGHSLEDPDRTEILPKPSAAFRSLKVSSADDVLSLATTKSALVVLLANGHLYLLQEGQRRCGRIYPCFPPLLRLPHATALSISFVRMSVSESAERGVVVSRCGRVFYFNLKKSTEHAVEKDSREKAKDSGRKKEKTLIRLNDSPSNSPPLKSGFSNQSPTLKHPLLLSHSADSAAFSPPSLPSSSPSLTRFSSSSIGAFSLGSRSVNGSPRSNEKPKAGRFVAYLQSAFLQLRVVDACVADGHTTVVDTEGCVYQCGPKNLIMSALKMNLLTVDSLAAVVTPIQPRSSADRDVDDAAVLYCFNGLRQIRRLSVSDGHLLAVVQLALPTPFTITDRIYLPSFMAAPCAATSPSFSSSSSVPSVVPSLLSFCEVELCQRIDPRSFLQAFQFAASLQLRRLCGFCAEGIFLNFAFYSPILFPDSVAHSPLTASEFDLLDQAYTAWCRRSARTQKPVIDPVSLWAVQLDQDDQHSERRFAGKWPLVNVDLEEVMRRTRMEEEEELEHEENVSTHVSDSVSSSSVASDSPSLHALPLQSDEYVVRLRRTLFGYRRRLQQIALLETQSGVTSVTGPSRLDGDQLQKIRSKGRLLQQLAELQSELQHLEALGSIAAAALLKEFCQDANQADATGSALDSPPSFSPAALVTQSPPTNCESSTPRADADTCVGILGAGGVDLRANSGPADGLIQLPAKQRNSQLLDGFRGKSKSARKVPSASSSSATVASISAADALSDVAPAATPPAASALAVITPAWSKFSGTATVSPAGQSDRSVSLRAILQEEEQREKEKQKEARNTAQRQSKQKSVLLNLSQTTLSRGMNVLESFSTLSAATSPPPAAPWVSAVGAAATSSPRLGTATAPASLAAIQAGEERQAQLQATRMQASSSKRSASSNVAASIQASPPVTLSSSPSHVQLTLADFLQVTRLPEKAMRTQKGWTAPPSSSSSTPSAASARCSSSSSLAVAAADTPPVSLSQILEEESEAAARFAARLRLEKLTLSAAESVTRSSHRIWASVIKTDSVSGRLEIPNNFEQQREPLQEDTHGGRDAPVRADDRLHDQKRRRNKKSKNEAQPTYPPTEEQKQQQNSDVNPKTANSGISSPSATESKVQEKVPAAHRRRQVKDRSSGGVGNGGGGVRVWRKKVHEIDGATASPSFTSPSSTVSSA